MYTLDKVLKDSVAAHASDIHFTVGCSPFFRIDGMLIPQEGEKLMPKDMEELLLPILDQRHRKELEENGQTDLAYAIRGGDVKLMFACGLILGWKPIILSLFLSCIIASVIHLILIHVKNAGKVLAMGPYLSVGIFIAALWGNQWINWYLSLLCV